MHHRNIGRDMLIISTGPLGSAIFSILLIFIVSWNFPPEILGALAILELVALLFTMAFALGLDQAYVREYSAAQDKLVLFASAMRVPVASAAAAAIALAGIFSIVGFRPLPAAGDIGTFVALGYGVGALIIRMLSITLRMKGVPYEFAASQIAQRAATVVVLTLFLLLSTDRSLLAVMTCYLAGTLISVSLHLFFCRAEASYAVVSRADRPLFRSLLKFGIPAATAAILYALLSSADRISLAALGNNRDLGIYAVALSIAGSVNIFTSIFAVIWAPLVYKNEDQARDASAMAPYLDIVTMLTFCAAGATSAASWFLPMVFPADYAGVAYFVPACMALPLLYILSEAFGIGIGVSRRMGFATLASAVGAGAALGVSFLLVPGYGATGAAFGILTGALFFLVARTEFGAFLWYRLPSLRMYAATALYFSGCVISLLWASGFGIFFPVFWIFFCAFSLLLFHRRIGLIVELVRQTIGQGR